LQKRFKGLSGIIIMISEFGLKQPNYAKRRAAPKRILWFSAAKNMLKKTVRLAKSFSGGQGETMVCP
jgi:hypothetical protein